MTAEIKINKIKILNDSTAEISYKSRTDLGTETIHYSGTEKVTDEFYKAFQKGVDGFVACLPILEKDMYKITMNVLQFDYDKSDKVSHALYSVKYAYNEANNAVVNITTPKLPIFREEFDEKTFCINGKYEQDLYEIIELAKAYLKGDTRTKQMKLEVVA